MVLKIAFNKPVDITDLSSYVRLFKATQPKEGHINFYRGHSDKSYILSPSLFRLKSQRKDEKNILRELLAVQPGEFKDDRTVFEQLVRMQHYALPTRLLDITYNPLIALYFACVDNPNTDGRLLTFNIQKKYVKYFDSDTVSCVANLSNLSARQRNEIRNMTNDELAKSETGERLLHFIKAEKSYFLAKMKVEDLKGIFVVRPKQNNRRILAQQGAFIIFGLTSELKQDNNSNIKITKTNIPHKSKANILKELDYININASTIFPEIESAAKYIISKLTPTNDEEEISD